MAQISRQPNGADYKAPDDILHKAYSSHRISVNTIHHFGLPADLILVGESMRCFNFVGMPPGAIFLTSLRLKIECVRRRLWQQHDVMRKGLPCTAAFACTYYQV
jgi:hypothetical protein